MGWLARNSGTDIFTWAWLCRMTKELQGLYQKYQTNPLKLLMGPLANASVFIPMFFGLKKMGEFVPGEWEVP